MLRDPHTAIARLHDRTVHATTSSSSAARTQDNTPQFSAGRPRHATSLGRPSGRAPLARHGRGALQGGLAHLSELGCEDSRPRPCPLRTDGGRARERRRRALAKGRRPRSKCTVTRPPRPREHVSRKAHDRHVVSRGTLTPPLRCLGMNVVATHRGTPGEKKAAITCDGAVTYSCTTNDRRNDATHPHAPTAEAFTHAPAHAQPGRTRGASHSR